MPSNLSAEFDEDVASPIWNYSDSSMHSPANKEFTYCDADIGNLSEKLGIPWEGLKTVPFSDTIPYLGFDWDLPSHTISVKAGKKEKYKVAIKEWLSKPIHTLEEVQKLYGKLLHISLIIPARRAYLTSLEAMLGTFTSNPFVPHHPPQETARDLAWWLNIIDNTKIS